MADEVSRIRYGMIGTGMMGIEHFHNLLALDGAVVTAVATRTGSSEWARIAGGRGPNLRPSTTTPNCSTPASPTPW